MAVHLALICLSQMAYSKIAFRDGDFLKVSYFKNEKITTIDAIRKFIPPNVFLNPVKELLQCFDSVFQEDQKERETAKEVENLADYINPIGKLGCLVLMNNFLGINIQNVYHPVILRQPRPVLLPAVGRNTFDIELIWVPHHLFPTNGSKSTKNIIRKKCHLSKFLATFWETHYTLEDLHDYCLRIIQHSFAFSAKPWKCEAQIGLYPPLKLYGPTCEEIEYYPRIFNYEGPPAWTTTTGLNVNLPTINLLVTHKLIATELENLQNLVVAAQVQSNFRAGLKGPHIYQSVFFHGFVSPSISTNSTGKLNVAFPINYLKLLRVSYESVILHQPNPPNILIKYTKEVYKPENLSQSLKLTSSASSDDMTIWNVYGDLHCDIGNLPIASERSPLEIVSEWRSRTWLSIFGNYTFYTLRKTKMTCKNGATEAGVMPTHQLYLVWFMLEKVRNMIPPLAQMYVDDFRSLRFLSCSALQYEPLLFKELINIYQEWVWICMICVLVGLALLISYITRNDSLAKIILQVFKVIVGQGDSFMRHVYTSLPLRIAVITFLYMGIIINEGYKSSNMYHIISPRRIVSKENISELANSNFTVYTRTLNLDFQLHLTYFVNPETVTFEFTKHTVVAQG